jgi:hypothetical protein
MNTILLRNLARRLLSGQRFHIVTVTVQWIWNGRCPYGRTTWNLKGGEYHSLARTVASSCISLGRSVRELLRRSTSHYPSVQLLGVITFPSYHSASVGGIRRCLGEIPRRVQPSFALLHAVV